MPSPSSPSLRHEVDRHIKVIIVGDGQVGKSALSFRFVGGTFNGRTTVGVDILQQHLWAMRNGDTTGIFKADKDSDNENIRAGDEYVRMVIWDTAGQERFRAINRAYFRDSEGVIVAFDLTCRKSFHNVALWEHELRTHGLADVPVILVGTKADLIKDLRQVTREEAEAVAKKFKFGHYFETSSVSGQGVDECFLTLARCIYDQKACGHDNDEDDSISYNNSTVKKQNSNTYAGSNNSSNSKKQRNKSKNVDFGKGEKKKKDSCCLD